MTNVCFNCKHVLPHHLSTKLNDNAVCQKTKTIDLVTGENSYNFCSVERKSSREDACGKEGKFFEHERNIDLIPNPWEN